MPSSHLVVQPRKEKPLARATSFTASLHRASTAAARGYSKRESASLARTEISSFLTEHDVRWISCKQEATAHTFKASNQRSSGTISRCNFDAKRRKSGVCVWLTVEYTCARGRGGEIRIFWGLIVMARGFVVVVVRGEIAYVIIVWQKGVYEYLGGCGCAWF